MNWKDHIHINSAVLPGKPIIKGTRLSVDFLLGLLAEGRTEAQILESYPQLSRESLQAVFAFTAEVMRKESADSLNIEIPDETDADDNADVGRKYWEENIKTSVCMMILMLFGGWSLLLLVMERFSLFYYLNLLIVVIAAIGLTAALAWTIWLAVDWLKKQLTLASIVSANVLALIPAFAVYLAFSPDWAIRIYLLIVLFSVSGLELERRGSAGAWILSSAAWVFGLISFVACISKFV